jgi:hypothetical protein
VYHPACPRPSPACCTLLIAGHETTASHINLSLLLFDHPRASAPSLPGSRSPGRSSGLLRVAHGAVPRTRSSSPRASSLATSAAPPGERTGDPLEATAIRCGEFLCRAPERGPRDGDHRAEDRRGFPRRGHRALRGGVVTAMAASSSSLVSWTRRLPAGATNAQFRNAIALGRTAPA